MSDSAAKLCLSYDPFSPVTAAPTKTACRERPDAALLYRSAGLYKWCADYVHRVKDSMYLEDPCRDMAALVEDKAKWLLMTNRM